jgi:hypothetical protein
MSPLVRLSFSKSKGEKSLMKTVKHLYCGFDAKICLKSITILLTIYTTAVIVDISS